MKYSITFFALFIISINTIFSQDMVFCGELTYSIELVKRPYSAVPKEWEDKIFAPKMRKILIKDSLLNSSVCLMNGDLDYFEYQCYDIGYLMGKDKQKISLNSVPGNLHAMQLIQKTDNKKNILGIPCKKYIYRASGNKYVVWIPINFIFNDQRKYGRVFDTIFFPHGLAFEINIYIDNDKDELCTTSKLLKLELKNLSNEDFEQFTRTYKKQ